MISKYRFLYLMAGALLLGGAAATAVGDSFNPDAMSLGSLTLGSLNRDASLDGLDSLQIDSVMRQRQRIRIESFLKPAAADYARLREMRFEGADEADFFPQVYKAYGSNRTVLDSIADEPGASAAKSVLVDIRPELLEGAFHYSRRNDYGKVADFAAAYIDIPGLRPMADMQFKTDQRSLPTLAYIAASGAYNGRRFDDAIRYLDMYLATDDEGQRENAYMFLGQACLNTGKYDHGVDAMSQAAVLYPANYNILSHGIEMCTKGKRADMLQQFLDKALLIKPQDETLLMIQGKLYEDFHEYKKALEVFQQLDMMRANNLQINKHLALCYYNLGVYYYNDAIIQTEEKAAKRSKRQSNSYFNEAAQRMETILANNPNEIKYLEAAAVCYGCVDDRDRFDDANNRLRARGRQPQRAMSMPSMIAYNDDNSTNFEAPTGSTAAATGVVAPSYQEFAATYVTNGLAEWSRKGQFEKMDEYRRRVSADNVAMEYKRLAQLAEQAYMKDYAKMLRVNDLQLHDYDADNETYLITSSMGDITLKVPMANKEAEMFAASFGQTQLRNAKFIVRNDRPGIGSIKFVTPNGKSYTYDADDAADYTYTDVVGIDFTGIIETAQTTSGGGSAAGRQTAAHKETITVESDVDINIPVMVKSKANDHTVALIIANEDYKYAPRVASARHDGEKFAEYCTKTLGIPQAHVLTYRDASVGDFDRALFNLRGIVGGLNANRDVNVVVYYAGHGMPDHTTSDAFFIPTDGDSEISSTCYSMKKFYKELDNLNAANVVVFIDACFSGSARGDGDLKEGVRALVMKPKNAEPQGNMFILSATSGTETAMPYREKNHGMFTYYLLKKLQESKGNATLGEIADYVINNVRVQSSAINHKPQNPTVSTSGAMATRVNSLKLR